MWSEDVFHEARKQVAAGKQRGAWMLTDLEVNLKRKAQTLTANVLSSAVTKPLCSLAWFFQIYCGHIFNLEESWLFWKGFIYVHHKTIPKKYHDNFYKIDIWMWMLRIHICILLTNKRTIK